MAREFIPEQVLHPLNAADNVKPDPIDEAAMQRAVDAAREAGAK